ncbi:hypothetical protein [Streptomyces sp. NBC_01794]|uniref:hypothetical protein n=1 Tax=Streptomyces sp. NBC_01794 TaxID=2975942 RepID=UPI00308BD135|nr:hypothetical protein OIE54_00795 [Streptomyces sp. NBC_01794]
MSGEHLISDDETRQFVEGFLETSPWLGSIEWERIVIGPNAGYKAGFDGVFPADTELSDGQKWSWRVSFSDPAGTRKTLCHETVLEGLSRIVYGDHAGSEGFRYMSIKQWFTEPTETRRALQLSASEHSLICQRALYDKIVFPTGEAEKLFGKKLDMFEDQRPDNGQPDS